MDHRKVILRLATGLIALVALVVVGCSSKSTLDNEAPPNTTVSVSAAPTSLQTSQTSVIEANVSAGGAGLPNQIVRFTVDPSSAGSFTPEADTTGSDGIAATAFTASASGSAVVTAQVEGTTLTSSIGMSISQAGGGGTGTGSVNVSVSRSLLLANNQDTSVVTIAVRDELGQPVGDGTLIRVAAGERFVDVDGNGYWSDGIDSLVFDVNSNSQWDSHGLIPSSATTTGGTGNATVNYVSGSDAVTVYLKISVDDGGVQASVDVPIQITPNATLNSIFLAVDSVTLSVKNTGGIETSWLRATGFDINGNPMPEGVTIVFSILDGPGGGEHLDTLGYGPDSVVTNSQGIASTTIHSGTISGTVRVRAYADVILSNATQVLIEAGPPAQLVVGARNCNVPWWDDVGDSLEIRAIVSDIYLNPVNDSTVVYFTVDEGTMKSHNLRVMNGNGSVISWWWAGTNVPTADGRVWIYAETAGGTVSDSSLFFNSHFPFTLTVSGWQTTILADGKAKFFASIGATDLNTNPVENETQFLADALYLTVQGGSFADGCYSSSDRVVVTSATLEVDASTPGGNDDGVGAIDFINYWHPAGASVVQVCSLLTGGSYEANSSINGETKAGPGDQVRLSATIADRWSNPLGDHTLIMTTSGGSVSGATQETNEYGEAGGFIWTAPVVDGDYTVWINDSDPRGGIYLSHKITVETPAP